MGSIKRYLQWVKPYKWPIIGTILIGIVKFTIPLLLPLVIKYVVDDIIGAKGLTVADKNEQLLYIMGGMLFLFLALRPPIE